MIRTPGSIFWTNYGHFQKFSLEKMAFSDKSLLIMTIVCSLKILDFSPIRPDVYFKHFEKSRFLKKISNENSF